MFEDDSLRAVSPLGEDPNNYISPPSLDSRLDGDSGSNETQQLLKATGPLVHAKTQVMTKADKNSTKINVVKPMWDSINSQNEIINWRKEIR